MKRETYTPGPVHSASGRSVTALGAAVLILATFLTTRPAFPQVKTLGPAGCGTGNTNCHASENNWWKSDPHSRSSKPFENLDPDYADLARKYGIDPADDASVNQKCMTCHGTVVTGLEKKPVGDGVSCESCHGPGSGFLDPHQNPDYQKGIAAGLRDLRQGGPRAKVCVDCHFTADAKLVRSGHPSGWSNAGKYVRGMQAVAGHWGSKTSGRTFGSSPVDSDESPFAVAIRAKGPAIAAVPVAGRTAADVPGVRAPEDGGMTTTEDPGRVPTETFHSNSVPDALQVIVLGPFPMPSDSTSVSDILSLLKDRLDRVYTGIQSAYGGFR